MNAPAPPPEGGAPPAAESRAVPGTRLAGAASIVAALLTAAGVLLLDWPPFTILALFWCDNVIIGSFNVMRILVLGWVARRPVAALATAVFFGLHYGIFCVAHGLILAELFGQIGGGGGPLDPLGAMIGRVLGDRLGLLVLALLVVLAAEQAWRAWRADDPQAPRALKVAMAAPYGRIVVLHLALLGGAFALQALGAPSLAVLLLVALKLVFDLRRIGARGGPAARQQRDAAR